MAEAATLERELKTYSAHLSELEGQAGKFVLIRDSNVEGTFDSFDDAATEAVRRFGRGPYLIRQIGAPQQSLPASVVYSRFENA
jgi:hypothetical protein